MPLTGLDTNAALVVFDLQKVIAGLPTVHPAGEIISRAARLAHAFRVRSLSAVLVKVTGRPLGRTDAGIPKFSLPPDWTELVPEFEQQPSDFLLTKQLGL
jgi:nicotinamidase-related amidase